MPLTLVASGGDTGVFPAALATGHGRIWCCPLPVIQIGWAATCDKGIGYQGGKRWDGHVRASKKKSHNRVSTDLTTGWPGR